MVNFNKAHTNNTNIIFRKKKREKPHDRGPDDIFGFISDAHTVPGDKSISRSISRSIRRELESHCECSHDLALQGNY